MTASLKTETLKFSSARPVRLADVKHWDMETDVAIVGFGGAGSCAAIEAADAGAAVTVFELASASGGSTAMSSGEVYLGGSGGTRVQKACGFEDSTENMFKFLMAAHGPQADETKVRTYVENAVKHFDWLVERGVPFKDSFLDKRAIVAITDDGLLYTGSEKAWPFRDIAKPVARGHNLQVLGDNGGPLLMKILTENVEKRKNIQVHYDTRALCLIADEQNRVQGLVVRINMKEQFVPVAAGDRYNAAGLPRRCDPHSSHRPGLRHRHSSLIGSGQLHHKPDIEGVCCNPSNRV